MGIQNALTRRRVVPPHIMLTTRLHDYMNQSSLRACLESLSTRESTQCVCLPRTRVAAAVNALGVSCKVCCRKYYHNRLEHFMLRCRIECVPETPNFSGGRSQQVGWDVRPIPISSQHNASKPCTRSALQSMLPVERYQCGSTGDLLRLIVLQVRVIPGNSTTSKVICVLETPIFRQSQIVASSHFLNISYERSYPDYVLLWGRFCQRRQGR
jgi:hypothetical protein